MKINKLKINYNDLRELLNTFLKKKDKKFELLNSEIYDCPKGNYPLDDLIYLDSKYPNKTFIIKSNTFTYEK